MLESARTNNLNLYTYSEVEDVTGFVGNFKVKIRKKAKYVNNDCNGCGSCFEVCPAFGYDEFNEGMNTRKAIYVSFAQAVPSKAQIDMDRCIKCGLCQKACEVNAIDFNQEDEILELEVGSIIVSTGWDEYVPDKGYLGYDVYPNVITQQELENKSFHDAIETLRDLDINADEMKDHQKRVKKIARWIVSLIFQIKGLDTNATTRRKG